MKKLFTLLLLAVSAFTLKSSAQNTSCNAGFDFNVYDFSVHFRPSITINPTINHHYWNFGDGSISSDTTPVHIYTSAGTYTVKHIFYRSENGIAVCVDSLEKRVVINTPPPPPPVVCNLFPKFSFERDSSQTNKIKFKNLSTPPNDIHIIKWSFGDGTYSNDFNTSHVYTTSGSYTVCLLIQKDSVCHGDTCAQIQIQLPPPPCNLVNANFIWYGDSLQINKIHFANLSSHFERGDSIWWSFGDGTYSTELNPTHIYANPGTYNVCIRIKKTNSVNGTSCVKEICKQIVVQSECRLEANFNWSIDSSNHSKVYFRNLSTPPTAAINIQWSFGDGTSSASLNPDHIYAHSGVYNVCLKISASNTCYREVCKTIEIKEPEINCNDISKFTFTRSTVNCLEFKFRPVTLNPNWKYIWSFGDGTGSTDSTPSHVYPRSGNYTVFLTVYRSASCVSTSYKVAETGACFSCNNISVKYEYTRASSLSNTLYFHAVSNYPVISQTWVITKVSVAGSSPVTLTQNNLVYTFNEPGDYRVCLRAVTYGQCVKEYCEVIHINSPNTACTLTAYPNPASNQVSLTVELPQPAMIHVYIFNSLNILVKQKEQQGNTGNNLVTTNIEGLVPGWYTVKVIYGNRICYSRFQKI